MSFLILLLKSIKIPFFCYTVNSLKRIAGSKRDWLCKSQAFKGTAFVCQADRNADTEMQFL